MKQTINKNHVRLTLKMARQTEIVMISNTTEENSMVLVRSGMRRGCQDLYMSELIKEQGNAFVEIVSACTGCGI